MRESHAFTPAELAEQLTADRAGAPYLLYRDGRGVQRIVGLGTRERITIGRLPESDVVVDWDSEVSRAHAQLERVAGRWTVVDDGLSRNGTFVNGARIAGRRGLDPGDVLRVGRAELLFRDPLQTASVTAAASDVTPVSITEAQRRVLLALSRPLLDPGVVAAPASNRAIADELCLSIEAVRTHLKSLYESFAIPDLPQNRKRAELVQRAIQTGTISRGGGRASLPATPGRHAVGTEAGPTRH